MLDHYGINNYDTYWATEDTVTTAWAQFEYEEPRTFNRVLLQEYIPLGQRVRSFVVEVPDGEEGWRQLAEGTTIGYKRILHFPQVSTDRIRVRITSSKAAPVLESIGLYLDASL